MRKWKKNMVAGAVLVAVCAGIYVNWMYTEDQTVADITSTLDEEKLLSTDMLVIGEDQLVLNDENTTADYFASVRLSRQQARDRAVGLLQEAMAYEDDELAQKTNSQLERIIQTALSEAQIESLIIAKGYTDCVAYISDSGISVAVSSPEDGLNQEDVAVISDIVLTQSDFEITDIRVVEVQ